MTDAELAVRLLEKAGIPPDIRQIAPLASTGITNRMSAVRLADGTEYILRRYAWPHDVPDTDRLEKEIYLHDLLHKKGVPVARILAAEKEVDRGAILMEKLPGRLLGEASPALASADRAAAWRACGEALRLAHSIQYPPGTFGQFVGTRVEPHSAETWGHFLFYNVLHHARTWNGRGRGTIDLASLEKLLETAVPLLDDHTPVLLHNDPHPWNVLVDAAPDGWRCSGWLDWEYAWVGDPVWDLVRMDLFRVEPIGPTPDPFYHGYGAFPAEPNRSLYELSIYLWQADEAIEGPPGAAATRSAALEYVAAIDIHLPTIRELVESPPR